MKMKKILACALLGLTSVTLVACDDEVKDPVDDNVTDDNVTEDEGVAVTFKFPEDNTYKVFDSINVKSGVEAYGDDDNRYTTFTVTCATEGALDGNTLNSAKAGTFELTYSITIKGKTSTAKRTITIVENGVAGDNILAAGLQGNYADLTAWGLYDNAEKFSVNESKNIVVDATSSADIYATRLDTSPSGAIQLVDGQLYQILITAKATQARDFQIQVGNMFSDTPWWTAAADPMTMSLTTEMSTKAVYFTADGTDADLKNIVMTLEMGDCPTFISSTIEIESVSLHTFEGEFDDEVSPVITQTSSSIIKNAAKVEYTHADILEMFTFADNVTTTDKITKTVERITAPTGSGVTNPTSITTEHTGTWTVTVSATDEAGNKTQTSYSIVVRDANVDLDNYFTGLNFTSWSDVGWTNLKDTAALVDDFTIEYGVYYFWYDPQAFVTSDYMDEAGTYTVSMTLTNSTARSITVAGNVDGVPVTDSIVTFVAGETKTISLDINVLAGQRYQMQILFDTYKEDQLANTVTPDNVKEELRVQNLTLAMKAK